ncbi:MAG TPA: hypothetical protein VKU82_03920 [Planctomycetaceae bacterium]|nr:hypothetical protein [Planctomycetaceae bacterium]
MSPREERLSPGNHRPFVAGAPDWFNRARARSNQRHVFRARPVPIPPPASGRSFSGSSQPQAISRRFLKKSLPVVLSLIGLSAAFSLGFWSRGETRHARPEVADVRADADTPEMILPPNANHDNLPQVIGAMDMGANAGAPSNSHDIPSQDDVQSAPRAAFARAEATQRAAELTSIAAPEPAAKPAGASPVKATAEMDDGFALEPPVAANLIADVHLPENSWFALGRADSECSSGLCAAVPPLRNADRKLNTALAWNSSPEAAAAEARRDRKLVFLIHVSGNFAEPGFT